MRKLSIKPRGWKIWTGITLGVIFLISFLIIQSVIAVGEFFENNRIVRHDVISIKINPPFTIESRKTAMISPIPEKDIVKTDKPVLVAKAEASEKTLPTFAEPAGLEGIVKDVWMLESTQGKAKSGHHISCRERGMWNELGYNNYGDHCFTTKEEGFARVSRWFTEQLQELSLPQALCKYNTGTASNDCPYYQNYLTLQ